MSVGRRTIISVSAYVPPSDQEALQDALRQIRRLTRPRETGCEIIITGDFDRHDSLWGGDHRRLTKTRRSGRHCVTGLGILPRTVENRQDGMLRKPRKSDYTLAAAYRPLLLLNTLGKVLEAIMARRLSYWAEKHKLLPDTQFGGRSGRSTEQALLVLANAIDQAWLRDKVVTLVAFDTKGALNGVNKNHAGCPSA